MSIFCTTKNLLSRHVPYHTYYYDGLPTYLPNTTMNEVERNVPWLLCCVLRVCIHVKTGLKMNSCCTLRYTVARVIHFPCSQPTMKVAAISVMVVWHCTRQCLHTTTGRLLGWSRLIWVTVSLLYKFEPSGWNQNSRPVKLNRQSCVDYKCVVSTVRYFFSVFRFFLISYYYTSLCSHHRPQQRCNLRKLNISVNFVNKNIDYYSCANSRQVSERKNCL